MVSRSWSWPTSSAWTGCPVVSSTRWASSTYGLGLVIRDALARGVTEVVIGLGGSASTDGGAGMLQALGARLLDATGRRGRARRGRAGRRGSVDDSELDAPSGRPGIVVASDVDNPLLGPRGAAAVFGPQKGAGAADVVDPRRGAGALGGGVSRHDRRRRVRHPGTGAAGGTAFAAIALLRRRDATRASS